MKNQIKNEQRRANDSIEENVRLMIRLAAVSEALKECVKSIREEVYATADNDHPVIKRHAKIADLGDLALMKHGTK